MCVLIYRAPNGEIPDRDTLAAAWASNPDGAGFAYSHNGIVRYIKGLMTWEDFELEYTAEDVPGDAHLIIHFRYATHGAKSQGLTHPFPVAEGDILRPQGESLSVVAHNGILDCPVRPGHSDTSSFVLDIISDRKTYYGTGTMGMQHLINKACAGSRVIELTPYGALFYGDPWIEYGEGLYFSNLSFFALPVYAHNKVNKDRESLYLQSLGEFSLYCYYCGALVPDNVEEDRCPKCGGEPLLFQ